jgi:hypothetical protein
MPRYIDADALIKDLDDRYTRLGGTTNHMDHLIRYVLLSVIEEIDDITTVDAIPIDTVAEMLAELFGEECCCDYNGIDEWLPFLCEHSETCPETIGKNGCWKQFIKHWQERSKENAAD